MARKKKAKKKGSGIKKPDFSDERWGLLLGVAFLLSGLYVAVALISYFFTWQVDQDKVFRFSWSLLLEPEVRMSNALGRLGAFMSHILMYWGIGITSALLVYAFIFEGLKKLTENTWKRRRPYRAMILAILILPVLLSTVFSFSGFPWGGAYGSAMASWLSGFMGSIGLYALLFAAITGVIIWLFNPKFKRYEDDPAPRFSFPELKLPKFKSVELPSWLRYRISEMQADPTQPLAEGQIKVTREQPETLTPGDRGERFDFLDTPPSKALISEDSNSDTKLELSDDKPLRPSQPLVPEPSHELELETTEVETSREEHAQLEENLRLEKLRVEIEHEDASDPYDPKLDLSNYQMPPIDFLVDYHDSKIEIDRAELEANKDQIIATLLNYKIEITKIRATVGPTVTLYEIVPAPGVRISKIKNLEDDIALSLAALGIRIIAPIPGKGTIGIEVPNRKKQTVSFKEVVQSDKFQMAKMDLPIALGKTIANEVFVADLAKMPHLLIAGATGQGKSVGINSVLMSILYKKHPSQVKLVLIDPKKVELFPYTKIAKHFLASLPGEDEPIITDTKRVVYTLNSLCIEMDERYDLLKKARARNIREYNEKFVARKLNPNNGHRFLPFIVLVIDEFADLIMTAGKEVEQPIARLAQLARAIGIHLIIATQRPSVNIITGIIKANFPARIAFKVTSKVDSRTILDTGGADQLIGRGDMLLSVGGNTIRLQGAFVDTPEVEQVIDFIGDQRGYPTVFELPEFVGEEDERAVKGGIKLSELDAMFDQAAHLVVSNQHGSTSMIQRKLSLGYNRAGRIMDQLEGLGIVGEARGSKPREVLVFSETELHQLMNTLRENA